MSSYKSKTLRILLRSDYQDFFELEIGFYLIYESTVLLNLDF